MRHRHTGFFALSGAILVAAFTGCAGSKRPPATTHDTGLEGLPPLPKEIATDVYQADAYLSRACADVPSGLSNCQKWLRDGVHSRLIDAIDHDVRDTSDTKDQPGIANDGSSNGFSESATLSRELEREAILEIAFRELESPLMIVGDGTHLALRVLAVKDDVDYRILTAMAEKAARENRSDVAASYRSILRARFGSRPPDPKRVRDVENRVAEYYGQLWMMVESQHTKKR